MSPSSVTMPTPTLLALPSIPRQMCMVLGSGIRGEKEIVEPTNLSGVDGDDDDDEICRNDELWLSRKEKKN